MGWVRRASDTSRIKYTRPNGSNRPDGYIMCVEAFAAYRGNYYQKHWQTTVINQQSNQRMYRTMFWTSVCKNSLEVNEPVSVSLRS